MSLGSHADELVGLLRRASALAVGSPRQVVLVSGPPCAGKSSLVASHRRPGDVVADFDEVARSLGSDAKWGHPAAVRLIAEQEMQRIFDEIGAKGSGRAWAIRSVPVAEHRQQLAERLRADRVVVLLPRVGDLMRRAADRPRAEETRKAIRKWLARYTPSERDELVADPDGIDFVSEVSRGRA